MQDRTGRIIFKLFDKDPSNFPSTLRTQVRVMEKYYYYYFNCYCCFYKQCDLDPRRQVMRKVDGIVVVLISIGSNLTHSFMILTMSPF